MYSVTKDTLIADVVENAPEAAGLFQAIGMHCVGCAMAAGECIEDACAEYGVNVELFVNKLNEYIATQAAVAAQN